MNSGSVIPMVPMPSARTRPSAAPQDGAGQGRKRILVVDDDAVIVRTLGVLLRNNGYEVLTARDGGDAISIVRCKLPDLILLDISFPPDVAHGGGVAWDGFLILSWLRRMDEAKDIPVIIISATDPEKYQARCSDSGIRALFKKPIHSEELVKVIAEVFADPKQQEGVTEQKAQTRKVLFVDDESDWRFMASDYLQSAGYEVWTAKNGAEALTQIAQACPDLVILDLNLGGESGIDLLKELKQKHPEVPVLLYTGMDHDAATVKAMLREGAHQYLRKGALSEMLKSVNGAMAGVIN